MPVPILNFSKRHLLHGNGNVPLMNLFPGDYSGVRAMIILVVPWKFDRA